MTANFDEIKSEAEQLKSSQSARTQLFDDVEMMYFLEAKGESSKASKVAENVKLTLDPGPRDQLLGAVRLLVASDPVWSVPYDKEQAEAGAVSDAMEKSAAEWWGQAGRAAMAPVSHDMALSGLMYDEVHVAVQDTQQMLDWLGPRSSAQKARLERIAGRTPFLYRVRNPRDCFARLDEFGFDAHLTSISVSAGRVISIYGKEAEAQLGDDKYKQVTLNEWWDLENQVVWVDGQSEPLVNEEHGLPFIPIGVMIPEGSAALWPDEIDKQRQPFLYAIAKSGLWHRRNLALTAMYTLIFGVGANPIFVYRRNQEGKEVELDFSRPGGVVNIEQGESFEALIKRPVDPSLLQGWELSEALLEDATMYKAVRGQPLGANAPYSMVALLSQSGRLPLVSPQQRLGWMLGGLMEISFDWLKHGKRKYSTLHKGNRIELDPGLIPDDYQVEAGLEVSLPQDRLQAANVASILMQAGLVSKEWIRQELLQIGQSGEMDRDVYTEKLVDMMVQDYARRQQEAEQMKQQQMMQQGMKWLQGLRAGATPGTPGPMPGQSGTLPGQMPGASMPVELGGGAPPQGGLPPEMMAAGAGGPQPIPGVSGPEMPPELG